MTLADVHVDAATVHLVRRPGSFDVLLTENMHGDILSDLAGELAGALGMSPSLNAGDEKAMAQAAHGSAPDIAGRGIANPVGMMLSAAMLLRWLADRWQEPGLATAGDLAEGAVVRALEAGRAYPTLGRRHGVLRPSRPHGAGGFRVRHEMSARSRGLVVMSR